MTQRPDRYTLADSPPQHVAGGLEAPERLAAIRETGLLDAPAEEAFDRFTRLASRLLGASVALINFITDERQVVLSSVGLDEPWATGRQMPLSHSFCQHMIEPRTPLIVADARDHPVLRESLAVESFGVVAYAGVPLVNADDEVLGAFCVIEPIARTWTDEDVATLRDLAAAVINEIDLRVSQARLARERTFLEGVLANLQDGVFACDTEGQALYFNDAIRRLEGVSTDDLPDHVDGFVEWVRITDQAGLPIPPEETATFRALRGERTERRLESVEVVATGEHLDMEVSASPIHAPDGELLGAVTVSHDVTEQRAAERVRDEFFALVSHELRTPVAAISGYLEILDEVEGSSMTEEGRNYLRVLERNGDRLRRLVDDLLFTAQVEAGTLSLNMGSVDVRALVLEAGETARPRADQAEIELDVEVADGVPAQIPGDGGRLAQVLDNLVSNALKFTPAGGRIAVAASSGDGCVELRVSDTGVGIPLEEQGQMFDRFARSRGAEERAVPGVGLGLSICRAIVEGHDGGIELTSAPGEGTTFTVRLAIEPHAPSAG